MGLPRPSLRWRADAILFAALAIFLIAFPPARHTIGEGLALLATGHLGHFRDYLQSLGGWAFLVSITLMVVQALLVPLPVTIIMIANGLVFGLWWGTLVSLTGAFLGAAAAYVVGRSFGRELVQRLLPAQALQHADRLMHRYGGWAVVVARWIPGMPCDPMSYAAGVTHMPVGRFYLMTILGLLPANLVASFVGVEVAGDVPLVYWIGGWTALLLAWLLWRARKKTPRRPAARS